MSKEQFIDNFLNTNREYYKSYKELHRLNEAAENLELDTLQILKDNGVSRSDRFSFLGSTRYFKPLDITEQMRLQMLQSNTLREDYYDILLEIKSLNKTLNQLPVLVNPENEIEIQQKTSDEVDDIFKNLRLPKATGGLVKGKDDVPYTKEDPSDRVDPFTGSPYSDQMARLGLNEGGNVNVNISQINNLLKELGYSKEARAAKLGNIGVETGYTYDYRQKQKNGKGYGLYQLDFQRPYYDKYLESNKLKDSLASQVMFTHEVLQGNDKVMGMNTKDRKALQEAFKSKDVSFITQMFSEKYEKPGVPHLEKRIEEANKLYELID